MSIQQPETTQPTALDWDSQTVADELHGAITVAAHHAKHNPDQAAAVIASALRDLDEVERHWLAGFMDVFERRHRRFHADNQCQCNRGSEATTY